MTTTPNLWKTLTQVNTTDAGAAQDGGQIVALDDGGYEIIWTDKSHVLSTGAVVMGQRYDAQGNKVGGEVQISQFFDGDDSNSDGSSVTNLHNGTIAVTYTDLFSGDHNTWVRVVDPALNFVRNDRIDSSVGVQTLNSSIASFADGSYVVSYTLDNGGGNTDILARIVSPTGTVGGPITVRDNGTLDANFSQLATLSNGNFVDAYQQTIGSDHDIYFSIYTQAGAVVANNFGVSGALGGLVEETDPDVVALAGGGFVVAWTDANGDGAGNPGVRASIYNNAGGVVAADIALNTTTAGAQNEASLVALADGGFVATWEDDNADLVRGQRFDALGNKVGTEYTVKVGVSSDSPDSALLADGRIGYAVGDVSSGDPDVMTSIFDPRTLHQNFDGINHGDFLWQHDSGQAAVWLLNGTTQIGAATVGPNPGPSWHLLGDGDFNQDGHSDFLWQNDNGQAAVWLINGTTQIGAAFVGANPGPSWHVKDSGDFNGDGKDDILWQDDSGQAAIWLMNGTTPVGGGTAGPNPGADWHAIAAGDFNGDAHADILWQNDNGQAAIWLMNGTTQIGAALVGPNPGPSWHVIDSGDFNGDGKGDILWQNDSGQAAIWLINGTTVTGAATVGPNPGADWHLEGAAEVNNSDVKSDLLWQNDNGQAAVWLIDGVNLVSGVAVGPNPGPDWHLV